jgi:hypothetical protein
MVTDRFDKLLEVNVSIKDNTARMVEEEGEDCGADSKEDSEGDGVRE